MIGETLLPFSLLKTVRSYDARERRQLQWAIVAALFGSSLINLWVQRWQSGVEDWFTLEGLSGYPPVWLGIALGLQLLSSHPFVQKRVRLQTYTLLAIPVACLFAWYELVNTNLFWFVSHWFGITYTVSSYWRFIFGGTALCLLVLVRRWKGRQPVRVAASAPGTPFRRPRVPSGRRVTFADIGGREDLKKDIRELVETRLHPERYRAYGIVRNGILLHGPTGTGKTKLADAIAGEFGIDMQIVHCSTLKGGLIGETGEALRLAFVQAAAQAPCVLFIDEIDDLGSERQSGGQDGGGAGREFNGVVLELMRLITHCRPLPGLVLCAATNRYDALDEALRSRFDLQLRVDNPDQQGREAILRSLLEAKPAEPFPLLEFARKTPGYSARRLQDLVNRASALAAKDRRKVCGADMTAALASCGGQDRDPIHAVHWSDVCLEPATEVEIKLLTQQLNGDFPQLPVPNGLLLLGPTGTGKTTIARLIATSVQRSFYSVTPSDLQFDPKRLSRIFARAVGNSPSILFFDEIDGIAPDRASGFITEQARTFVEQFLIEVSALRPEHRVFLIGATNHFGDVDPAIRNGDRFSEHLSIPLPGEESRYRILNLMLGGTVVEFHREHVSRTVLAGLSISDIKGIVGRAKRNAAKRAMVQNAGSQLPPVTLGDMQEARDAVS